MKRPFLPILFVGDNGRFPSFLSTPRQSCTAQPRLTIFKKILIKIDTSPLPC